MEVNGHLHDTAFLLQEKEHPPPLPSLEPRPKNRSGLLGKHKNFLSLPGIEHRIVHSVASSLYILRSPVVSAVLIYEAVSLENLWATIRR